ncbi:MAG: hypothetical protein I4N50_22040 [Rhizobium sp.]|nr:hypothetical protein [Rhizobium sp.]
MMYYRHSGINYQENSVRIDATRASFASLPGELRNLAYATTLRWPTPISVTYKKHIELFVTHLTRTNGRTPMEALQLLSGIDHNIRCEARSYFFANNIFQIETTQTFTTDPDYIQVYIDFLENIGLVGRRSLRYLHLMVSSDCKHHVPTASKATKFWSLIAGCGNLVKLDVYAEIDYFYIGQQAALKLFMSTEGAPISKPWPVVLEILQSLKNLKNLVLRPVFNGRWRFFDLFVNGRIVTATLVEHLVLKSIRFRVRRPILEATQVTEQLKGYVRKSLRGAVRVQVLRTELWEEYGRDIRMVRDYERDPAGDMWSFRSAGIIKPYGRAFNYTKNFKPE